MHYPALEELITLAQGFVHMNFPTIMKHNNFKQETIDLLDNIIYYLSKTITTLLLTTKIIVLLKKNYCLTRYCGFKPETKVHNIMCSDPPAWRVSRAVYLSSL